MQKLTLLYVALYTPGPAAAPFTILAIVCFTAGKLDLGGVRRGRYGPLTGFSDGRKLAPVWQLGMEVAM